MAVARSWRDDVELAAGPVRGHLAAAAGGVVGGADGLQKLLLDGVAEGEAEGAVAVVGEEPVVAGPQGHAGGDEQGFVAGAGDLEEDLLLALEDDLAVVGPAGEVHEPVKADQFGGREIRAGRLRPDCCFRAHGGGVLADHLPRLNIPCDRSIVLLLHAGWFAGIAGSSAYDCALRFPEVRRMPTLHGLVPILPVRDMPASVAFYQRLGFNHEPYEDGASYAFLSTEGLQMHLTCFNNPEFIFNPCSVYLYVEDVKAACEAEGRPGSPR